MSLHLAWMVQLEAALAIVVAAVLGAVIGAERELRHRPAGLRTHALLAAAAALLVELSGPLAAHLDDPTLASAIRADPLRIAQAIVTGVAFIGAGTIFRHRGEDVIEGLTTATTLLLVSAIGIAVALGEFVLAATATATCLIVLRVLRRWENKRGRPP